MNTKHSLFLELFMIGRFSNWLLAVAVLAGGCAQGQRPMFAPYKLGAPATQPSAVTAGERVLAVDQRAAVASANDKPRLAPGDVIELKVYQEDELNGRVRVDGNGTVTLPLLGAVKVSGKTVEETSGFIRDLLERDYLFEPHVTVTVAEFAKKRFSVMGEVKVPGFYVIPESETINVLQALSMAGGYTAFSRGTRIQVKRIVGGKEVVLWVDAKAMARKKNIAPLEILPGDAITVNSNIF